MWNFVANLWGGVHFQSNFQETYAPTSKLLGAGTFGVVFQAKDKDTNEDHAVKRISQYHHDSTKIDMREVTAAMTLTHKNIVRYISHWQEKPPEGKGNGGHAKKHS
jgi:hypothetical protein